MSKIFSYSKKTFGPNTGLLMEDNEISTIETRGVTRNNDSSIFLKPSIPTLFRNPSAKSDLIFRNINSSVACEEIKRKELNSCQSVNQPSTSFQPICRQEETYTSDICNRQDRRLFCPAPRKTLFNSRIQHRNEDSYAEVNNESSPTRMGLGERNSLLSSIRFNKFTNSLRSDENYLSDDRSLARKFNFELKNSLLNSTKSFSNPNRMNFSLSLKDRTLLPGMSSSESRISIEKSMTRDKFSDSSVVNFRNRNSTVNMSTALGCGIRNSALESVDSALDKTKLIEEKKNDYSCFVRPSLSRFVRHKTSTMTSHLFNPNIEQYAADTSSSSRFRPTYIPKRDYDTLSDSKFMSTIDNQFETRSLAGVPMISAGLVMNILENLHHSMLHAAPNVPVDEIKKTFDQAKEIIENRSEISFAHSVRDMDAASVTSYSSKLTGLAQTYKELDKYQDSVGLKSGKDILNSIMSETRNRKLQKLSSIQEEKLDSQPASAVPMLEEDDEDSALVFKKPKPFIQSCKNKYLKIKTPQPQKTLSKKSKQIINLIKWYPVISGKELIFKGTAENGTSEETEPVKKRVTNRKLVLVNGLECNLIGSPLDSIISSLPGTLASKLNDGLTSRWKIFQKELIEYQLKSKNGNILKWVDKGKKSPDKNVANKSVKRGKDRVGKEEVEKELEKEAKESRRKAIQAEEKKIAIYDTTPTTRRKSPLKTEGGLRRNVRKSVIVTAKKTKIRSSFGGNKIIQNASLNKSKRKSPKENEKSVSSKNVEHEKSKNISSIRKRDTPSSCNSSKNNTVGSSSRTRSGRTVKPPSFFGLIESQNKNSETPKNVLNVPSTLKTGSNSKKKTPQEKKTNEKGSEQVHQVYSSTSEKNRSKSMQDQARRKRKMSEERDLTGSKKSKLENSSTPSRFAKLKSPEKTAKKAPEKKKEIISDESQTVPSVIEPKKNSHGSKAKGKSNKTTKSSKVTTSKKMKVSSENLKKLSEVKNATGMTECEDDFVLQLDDIEIPERGDMSGRIKLNRSQLRHLSSETPPLKYFNNNLKLLRNITPDQSPNWCISQRTETEVRNFQRRQVIAQKKKEVVCETKKTVTKVKTNMKNRDLRSMLNWVADKVVRTPTGNSKVLKYMIPSRKQMELEEDEDDDEEDIGVVNDPFEL